MRAAESSSGTIQAVRPGKWQGFRHWYCCRQKEKQCFPLLLSSPAKPAERFRYSSVAHLDAGRKLVANIKIIDTPTQNYTEHKCNTNLY